MNPTIADYWKARALAAEAKAGGVTVTPIEEDAVQDALGLISKLRVLVANTLPPRQQLTAFEHIRSLSSVIKSWGAEG